MVWERPVRRSVAELGDPPQKSNGKLLEAKVRGSRGIRGRTIRLVGLQLGFNRSLDGLLDLADSVGAVFPRKDQDLARKSVVADEGELLLFRR